MSQIKASDIVTTLNGKQDPVTTSTNLTVNSLRSYGTAIYTPSLIFQDTSGTTYLTINNNSSKRTFKTTSDKYINIRSKVFINQVANNGYSLEVPSSSSVNYPSSGSLNLTIFNAGQQLTYGSTNLIDVCARFQGSLWCSGKVASSSDIRIKTNIQDIDDDSALQLILKIQPKTYQYIDKFNVGDKKVYGFISQQIRDVIPEAVSIQPLFIPNIYKIGVLSNSNVITMDTDISNIIKIDSDITLITSNIGKKEYKVTDVNSNQFKIDTDINDSNNVFVYGTKVNDFHLLDKTYIYTLNVCATQELYKLIQSQITKINQLRDTIENMSNKIQQQENEINIILTNY